MKSWYLALILTSAEWKSLMSKFIATTNPKSVILIDRKAIRLSAKRNAKNSIESYSFKGMNFADFPLLNGLPDKAKIVLEISTDSEFERIDLGTKSSPFRIIDRTINFGGNRSNIKWYLFLAKDKNILARIENLLPDMQEDGETKGLVSVEPEDLGEILWRVDKDPANPIIQVNDCPKLDMISKIKDPIYLGLIFINAIEQFLEVYAQNPTPQNPGDWQENWSEYFAMNGIDDLPDEADDDAKKEWIDDTVGAMANIMKIKTKILENIS